MGNQANEKDTKHSQENAAKKQLYVPVGSQPSGAEIIQHRKIMCLQAANSAEKLIGKYEGYVPVDLSEECQGALIQINVPKEIPRSDRLRRITRKQANITREKKELNHETEAVHSRKVIKERFKINHSSPRGSFIKFFSRTRRILRSGPDFGLRNHADTPIGMA